MKFTEYLIKEKFLAGDNIRVRFGKNNDPASFISVHVNPDHQEVLSIIDDFRQTSPAVFGELDQNQFVRGFFDIKGDLYVWYGAFFHDNVERFLSNQEGTKDIQKVEGFRFAWIKGKNALTLEDHYDSLFFEETGNFKNEEERLAMVKKLIKAFPMVEIKGKNEDRLSVRTTYGNGAWVRALDIDSEKEKSKSPEAEKSTTKQSDKPDTKKSIFMDKNDIIKSLYKMGDTIVFDEDSPPALRGKEVKILAIAHNEQGYYYIYKARKGDSPTYEAQKFLDPQFKIEFIDGKFNIKKSNEPFAVIKHNGSYIKKIIPDPARLQKLGNNLYEPRNVVSRGYTNPDRMEVKEDKK